MLTGFHLRIAQIVGATLGDQGFALGGGYALQAHGVTDRPSKDLDNYTESMNPDDFVRAQETLCHALAVAGFEASVVRADSWFRQIVVTDRGTGEQMAVDLGYDHREKPPVHVLGIGPVLDIGDVIVGKLRAFVDRAAERDFFDIDAILSSGKWTIHDLHKIVRGIRPELTLGQFAELLDSADTGDPAEYRALGMPVEGIHQMQRRLTANAALLRAKCAKKKEKRSRQCSSKRFPRLLPRSAPENSSHDTPSSAERQC